MSERKPLTLEELRDMSGKPVWIERNDPPNDGKWDLVDYADTEHPDKTLYTKNGVTYSEYGKYFTAYAVEPPRLDRSAWEPCEFCEKADFGEFGFEISKHYAKIVCALGAWRFPKNERFNFCPKCGRPLTDAAWEMMEKRLEGTE